MTFIQLKICCCVQHENRMIFHWDMANGDISIFKMAAVRHLEIVLRRDDEIWQAAAASNRDFVRGHTRSLCCWPQLPVKFHINLIHRSEYIAIWIFGIFGLKCLLRSPKWGFWGTLNLSMWLFVIETQKGTALRKSASFKLSTVKKSVEGSDL